MKTIVLVLAIAMTGCAAAKRGTGSVLQGGADGIKEGLKHPPPPPPQTQWPQSQPSLYCSGTSIDLGDGMQHTTMTCQ